jgi:hypothetical protein
MARKKRVKLYTKDDCTAWIFAEYVDGRAGVEFWVTLDRHFVGASRRGLPWQCLLVKAIEKAALEEPSLFPHPVKHAYVIGNTVYVIDRHPRRGNQIVHCVRYQHNFTKKLRKFDQFSKRRFLRHFGDEGCLVRLKPPRERDQSVGVRGQRPAGRPDGSRARVLSGAARRAHDAGLVAPAAFGA